MSNFHSNNGGKRFHTPTTFKAQRRLSFSPATASASLTNQTLLPTQSSSSTAPILRIDLADGKAYNLEQFVAQYGGSISSPPAQWLGAGDLPNINTSHDNELTLPWEEPGSKSTALFKAEPPKLVYPAGSRDEDVNKRFTKKMDHYLFKSVHVRNVLIGKRPHPFRNYDRLTEYWRTRGLHDWVFRNDQTFATLSAIKDNGDVDFHDELVELLWFGGSVSYGNIMRQVYAILYGWIDDDHLPDLEGLCEENDGITFRTVIIDSLRLVRVKHTQEIINSLYEKLDGTKLVMRVGGMAAFFGRLNHLKRKMKQHHEIVSDTYLLRRTRLAVAHKHKKLAEALANMRKDAGISKVPTKYDDAVDTLTDTFDFEIPIEDKNEKAPKVRVNYAGKRKTENGKGHNKRNKRVFEKGSCTHHPEATDHTTDYCWITKRERKGLPPGFQWCTVHDKGIHYEHKCNRHAPHFPPVPKPPSAAANNANVVSSTDILQMLGLRDVETSSQIRIEKPNKSAKTVTITPASPPRSALRVPTNSATSGPPVTDILQRIMNLSKPDRTLLATRLEKAGW